MTPLRPIGIFDSGIGGLSVLMAIRELLPSERIIYVADSANVPYGEKPEPLIRQRSLSLGRYLGGRGVKCIVVACNTATAAGIDHMRPRLSLPVIGMEPGIKPAFQLSKSGVVAVLGTSKTLASTRYVELVERLGSSGIILAQPCNGLVELIETGRFDHPEIEAMLRRYIEPLLARGADTLVLGCTHYPLVFRQIQKVAGNTVSIVDTGQAVARHVRNRLQEEDLLATRQEPEHIELWTTGDTARLESCARALLPPERCLVKRLQGV